MGRLKAALIREYEDNPVSTETLVTSIHNLDGPSFFGCRVQTLCLITFQSLIFQELNIAVHNPPNCQSVELYFRGEKMAKVTVINS